MSFGQDSGENMTPVEKKKRCQGFARFLNTLIWLKPTSPKPDNSDHDQWPSGLLGDWELDNGHTYVLINVSTQDS